jgi:hypothetical protein
MDILQSKSLIGNISAGWTKAHKDAAYSIVDIISNNPHKEYMSSSFFEFSLESRRSGMGLLHLNFYNSGIPKDTVDKIRNHRYNCVLKILNVLNKKFENKYNIRMADFIFNLSVDTAWPIHFGMDLDKTYKKIKIYLSQLPADNDLVLTKIERICGKLGLKTAGIIKKFYSEDFDALGFDFSDDGRLDFKIYTFYKAHFDIPKMKHMYNQNKERHIPSLDFYFSAIEKLPLRHIGFLYRISKEPIVGSVKVWARFNKCISVRRLSNVLNSRYKSAERWLGSKRDMIDSTGGKISYLTLEDSHLGVYFR